MTGIVHLLTYLDNQTGGMERQALAVSRRLRARGHRIFFITCIHASDIRAKHLHLCGTLDGFRVFRIPLVPWMRHLNAFVYTLVALVLLVLFRRRYSVIHAHQLYTSGVVATLAKLFLPNKYVVIKNCAGGLRGDILFLRKLLSSDRLVKFMGRVVDVFLAISQETKREMEEVGFMNILTIPNGVDARRFHPADELKPVMKATLHPTFASRTWILFVGKLDPQKNIFTLLRAVAALPNDTHVFIVGIGQLESELQQFVREHELENHVTFCGATNKVERYYQAADVFVLPSIAEGCPNVLLEAMSSGLACVGSDIESIREVIDHGRNGLIFRSYDNVDALKTSILQLLGDEVLRRRLGEEARKTILKRYDPKVIADQYSELYQTQDHPAHGVV